MLQVHITTECRDWGPCFAGEAPKGKVWIAKTGSYIGWGDTEREAIEQVKRLLKTPGEWVSSKDTITVDEP